METLAGIGWTIWLGFLLTGIVLALTPGPAVLFVISQGLSGGARTGFWSACGILSANLFYFALSATSLGAVLAASFRFFLVVKYIGAAYLIYLGLRAIFAKGESFLARQADPDPARRIYLKALALQMANPKALLFFTAILPQFVNPHAPIGPQMIVLCLTSMVPEFFILMAYSTLAGKASHLAANPKFSAWGDRVAGGLLLSAGTGLALANRE